MTSKLVRHVNLTVASVAGIVYAIDHVTNHVPTRMARVAWAGAATYADFKQNVPKRPEMEHSHPSEMPDNMDDLSLERKEYKLALREYNLRTAQRLLHVCKLNGGVFTKMGQQLASLNHALPAEYTSTLSELQDQALPVSFEVAKSAVERELGGPLKEFFSEFDESPIAAASLAQVHHAVTKDGKEVAVKIQYPLLAQLLDSDLWTVRQALLAIEKIWEINVAWIMPEIENALEAELNFESEKKNSRKIKHLFRTMPWVYIPEVYDDLSTDRILTMEYIHGVKVTDTKTIINKLGLKPEDVAGKVSSMFAEMVFCSGFVHCDPHPGNLFVRRHPSRPDEAQIVLLDHGLYRQLDENFRETFCKLWKALLLRDNELLVECGHAFNAGPYVKYFPFIFTYRSMGSKNKMGGQMSAEDKQALREDFKKLQGSDVNEFFEHLPRDMLFVFRSTNLTRSLNKELGGNSRQRFQIFGKYALKGLVQDHAANGDNLAWWQSMRWTIDYANLVTRLQLIDWSMLLYQKYYGIVVEADKTVG
ncbi:unnamed protein product [Aphanomyces euteiches]|uniref:ABC1 atypical kinase-like domain-containing protein n=1 Tax=Aphanomyces euteiches TaxID=100861 RepID=A0A6G0XEX7_9STRA|nr:hypothetical protein Ae201684_005375 [Aphanomyces euteiches]KAH9092747.1 hypothetical protein Ae201684P_008416 [Aphanomyces euteiches]KAH9157694.1 hypothetical protein AeRB84_000504 [Aphanomyces euteiches]